MYEELNNIIENGTYSNLIRFLNNNNGKRRKRIEMSIKKWIIDKKNCNTRRCQKQKTASKLLEADIIKINKLIKKFNNSQSVNNTNNTSILNSSIVNGINNSQKKSQTNLIEFRNKLLNNGWYNDDCLQGRQCDSHGFLSYIINKYNGTNNREFKSLNKLKESLNNNNVIQQLSCYNESILFSKSPLLNNSYRYEINFFIAIHIENINLEPYKIKKKHEKIIHNNYNEKYESYNFYKNYILLRYVIFSYNNNKTSSKIHIKINNLNKNIFNNNGEEYELFSMICHMGSGVSSGHYVTYVKKGNNIWYCSDSTINIQEGGFSKIDQSRHTPYVLLYKKVTHQITNNTEPVGLQGGANLCYANSAVQLFSAIPEMKNIINGTTPMNQ